MKRTSILRYATRTALLLGLVLGMGACEAERSELPEIGEIEETVQQGIPVRVTGLLRQAEAAVFEGWEYDALDGVLEGNWDVERTWERLSSSAVLENEASPLRPPDGPPLWIVGIGPRWPGRDRPAKALEAVRPVLRVSWSCTTRTASPRSRPARPPWRWPVTPTAARSGSPACRAGAG